jgi:hypothetical protein
LETFSKSERIRVGSVNGKEAQMKNYILFFTLPGLMLFVIFSGIAALAPACRPAHGDSDPHRLRAIEVPGPVGVNCYAIVSDSVVRGGNCLPAN